MFSSGVLSIFVLRPPSPVRRMVCSSGFSSCERRTLACSSSNSNPAHLCYSHLSALRSSGGSAALSLRLASESHLQPQFRRPVGHKQLECCCKQLSCDQSADNVSIRRGASSVAQAASKRTLSLFCPGFMFLGREEGFFLFLP